MRYPITIPDDLKCGLTLAFVILFVATAIPAFAQTTSTNQPAPPPAIATSTNRTEKNIRFQFDGLPYADVLERFAQMANKPLVTDTNIQGTLTFNDPQPYTF